MENWYLLRQLLWTIFNTLVVHFRSYVWWFCCEIKCTNFFLTFEIDQTKIESCLVPHFHFDGLSSHKFCTCVVRCWRPGLWTSFQNRQFFWWPVNTNCDRRMSSKQLLKPVKSKDRPKSSGWFSCWRVRKELDLWIASFVRISLDSGSINLESRNPISPPNSRLDLPPDPQNGIHCSRFAPSGSNCLGRFPESGPESTSQPTAGCDVVGVSEVKTTYGHFPLDDRPSGNYPVWGTPKNTPCRFNDSRCFSIKSIFDLCFLSLNQDKEHTMQVKFMTVDVFCHWT